MTASPAILNGRCHCLEKCDSDIKRICQKMRIDNFFEMRAYYEWIGGGGGGGEFLRTLIADMLLEGGLRGH